MYGSPHYHLKRNKKRKEKGKHEKEKWGKEVRLWRMKKKNFKCVKVVGHQISIYVEWNST